MTAAPLRPGVTTVPGSRSVSPTTSGQLCSGCREWDFIYFQVIQLVSQGFKGAGKRRKPSESEAKGSILLTAVTARGASALCAGSRNLGSHKGPSRRLGKLACTAPAKRCLATVYKCLPTGEEPRASLGELEWFIVRTSLPFAPYVCTKA